MDFHAIIHDEEDGSYWAEVKELPGCFASGFTLDELREALIEAIEMYLSADESAPAPKDPSPRPRVDEMKLVTA